MDIRSCCGSGGHASETIHLGSQQSHNSASTSSSLSSSRASSGGRARKAMKWRGMWTRLVKERRRDQVQVPSYDSYTYSQNFDQGVAWDEPDNISRSFSVRFADPTPSSRVYGKKKSDKMMSSIIEVG